MIEDRALAFRDFADYLKLEVSDLSPRRDKHNKEFVVEVRKAVERKYGKYFGPHTLTKVRGLEERVVSFAPGSFAEYRRVVGSDPEGIAEDFGGFHSIHSWGDVIGLASRKKCMSLPGAEEIVGVMSASNGITRRQSIKFYRSHVFAHNVIHEIMHAYQNDRLPVFFDECAVPYYILEVQKEMGFRGLIWAKNKDRIGFYETLVSILGEDVHGLFFGSKKDKKFKERALGFFTPEILSMLFPTGY